MTAQVDALIVELKASKYSSRPQVIICKSDDMVSAFQSLVGAVGPAGGDLFGTFPNPTVIALQGTLIDPNPPGANTILQFVGGVWKGL